MSSSQRPLQPPENRQYPYRQTLPSSQSYPPQAPSKPDLSTGRIIAIVLGSICAFLLLLMVGFGVFVNSLMRGSSTDISQRGSGAIASSSSSVAESSTTPSTSVTPTVQSKNFSQVIYSEYDRRGTADGRPSLAIQLSGTGIQHLEDLMSDIKDAAQQPGVDTLQIFTDTGSYISVDTHAAQNLSAQTWQVLLENLYTVHPAEYSIEVGATDHVVVKIGGADSLLYRDRAESELGKAAHLAEVSQLSAVAVSVTYMVEVERNHLISVVYSDFPANLATKTTSMVNDVHASVFAPDLAAVYFTREEQGKPQILIQLNPQTDSKKYSQDQYQELEKKVQKIIPQIQLKVAVKSADQKTPPAAIYEGK